MDDRGFEDYLKHSGRSQSAIKRCVKFVREFAVFLHEHRGGTGLDRAQPQDLTAFVDWLERTPKASANTHLWGIRYYFAYTSNEELLDLAGALRERRIKRSPFVLGKFRGADPDAVAALEAAGIRNVDQMLEAGRTPHDRHALAAKTGLPADVIDEFVKLSDLTRLGAVKTIRARLYHDAGVDTVEKMAAWDAEELRAMLIEFVERTGFDGIAPLPKEAQSAVATAKKLPKVVEF